jgi:asparagine synthase (glutamine-hydrolysing)
VNGRDGKLFLKRWASRFLPSEQLFARKRGFRVPIDRWLKEDFFERLGLRLPQHPAIRAWFRPAGVERLTDHARNTNTGVRMLWALLQFAIWYRLFIEGTGERPPAMQDPLELIV